MRRSTAAAAPMSKGRSGRQPKHKVWLHIGMPKTGTTTIQNVLFFNRNLLRKHGYFYPDFGDKQHVALVRELAGRAGSPIPFPEDGDCGPYERFMEVLDAQVTRCHTSIISSEYFFQRPGCLPGHSMEPGVDPFEWIRRTIDEVDGYLSGCEVRVLMWLRRQDNWLMSMYNQTVKSSFYTGEFDAYVENTVGAHLSQIVGMWIERFGRERVICRSYDALRVQNGNVVDSFLDLVCEDVPKKLFRQVDSSKNISLSSEALWLKKRVNGVVRECGITVDRLMHQRIRGVLQELTNNGQDNGAQFLSNEARKRLMAGYLMENETLIDKWGYAELRPLNELEDLDVPVSPAPEDGGMALRAVDQMIRTLMFAPADEEELPLEHRDSGQGDV